MNLDIFKSKKRFAALTILKGKKVNSSTISRSIGFENMYD